MAQSFLINQVANSAERDALEAQDGMQVFVVSEAKTYTYNGIWTATFEGTATLANGTIQVLSPNILVGSKVFVSYKSISGVPGSIYCNEADSVDTTSFVINSTSAGDNSEVHYHFVGTN